MPVYDLSYRRGTGARRRGPRWLPIYLDSVRHSWRNQWMRGLFLLCCLPAIGVIFTLYFIRNVLPRVGGRVSFPWLEFNLSMYDRFISWTWFQLVLLATGVGAGLIAEDRRTNALEIYFSRAIYRRDYLCGKVLGMTTVLLAASILPFILAWFFDCGLSTDTARFAATWDYPLRFLAYGLVLALPTSLVVLAISSFSRRSLSASVYWIALAFFSWFLGLVAARAALHDHRAGLFSYIHTFNALRYWIFDIPVPGPLATVTPPPHLAAMLVGLYSLTALLVLVRRTQPTEVIS